MTKDELLGVPAGSIAYVVEVRGIYDGWSFAVLKDGTARNRWPLEDRRHKPTEAAIAAHLAHVAEHGSPL